MQNKFVHRVWIIVSINLEPQTQDDHKIGDKEVSVQWGARGSSNRNWSYVTAAGIRFFSWLAYFPKIEKIGVYSNI